MVRRLFLTPPTMPETTVTRCLKIPASKEWLGIFNAALLQAINEFNYEQVNDTDLTATECAARVYGIYEAYLSERCTVCDCGCGGTQYRIGEDGTLEQSTDGGLTWTSASNADPRSMGTLLPPLPIDTGDVTRCAAANNVVQAFTGFVSQSVDELNADATLAEIAADTLAAMAGYLGYIGPIAVAATIVASHLLSFGGTALAAAFDGAVWDRLQCNVFCNISDDGTASVNQIANMIAQVNEDETGIARMHLVDLFTIFGAVGITNIGRAGTSTSAGCDDCTCGCDTPSSSTNYNVWHNTDFAGGTEGIDGICAGRFIGMGYAGNTLTLTLPDRAGRLVRRVTMFFCDANAAHFLTEVGGTDSDEGVQVISGSTNISNFSTPVDDDVVTITITDPSVGWGIITSVTIGYCEA